MDGNNNGQMASAPHDGSIVMLDRSSSMSAYGSQDSYGKATPESGLIDIRSIIRVGLKYWWLIVAIMLALGAIATFYLMQATPIFRASATLEVRQAERQIIDVSQVESVRADAEFLSTQIELLKSRSLAEDVINQLGLMRDPYLAGGGDDGMAALPVEERIVAATDRFRDNLIVSPVGRSRLIRVGFEHADPRQAAAIVNAISERFIEIEVDRKLEVSDYARTFLERRLEEVKVSLNSAERNLVDYANENGLILVDDEGSRNGTGSLDADALVELNKELTVAESDLVAARLAYEQSLINTYSAELVSNDAITRIRAAQTELNSEYIEKLARFKPDFPEMVELRQRIELFEEQIAEEEARLIEGRRQIAENLYQSALARRDNIAERVENRKRAVNQERDKSITYGILLRQVETDRAQYEALLQRLKELSLSDDIGESIVKIVDLAKVPRHTVRPNKIMILAIALLLGAASGLGLAILLDSLDNLVRDPDDVRNGLGESLMGVIPFTGGKGDLLSDLSQSDSVIAEAYSSLRTNLRYSGRNEGPRIIHITSTRAEEGKSTTSLGLALRMASVDRKVLLIDADLRRPTFKADSEKNEGLAGLLTSNAPLSAHVRKTRFGGLWILPSGPSVVNPSDILGTDRLTELLVEARSQFDYVILDSPPLLGLSDAIIIANRADATLMVVKADKLRVSDVSEAIRRLRQNGAPFLGVVLTHFRNKSAQSYSYYEYSYGSPSGSDKSAKKKSKLLLT